MTRNLQIPNSLKRKFSFFFLQIFLFATSVLTSWANDTCGRVAIINYQEVLVDTNSTKKGEGLRFYLDKDPMAKNYLDHYQNLSMPKWYNAAIGTLGTTLLIIGLSKSGSFGDSGFSSKRSFVFGGASVLAINFLMFKTAEYNNERILMRSIDEYNKRNSPRIYFSPFKEYKKGRVSQSRFEKFNFIIGITGAF